jgi:putative transposase
VSQPPAVPGLETTLDQELTEHLGHEKNGAPGPATGNVYIGRAQDRADREHRQVRISVPRDRAGKFGPQVMKKRQRRLTESMRSSCRCMRKAHR